jgi:hypothetical protein
MATPKKKPAPKPAPAPKAPKVKAARKPRVALSYEDATAKANERFHALSQKKEARIGKLLAKHEKYTTLAADVETTLSEERSALETFSSAGPKLPKDPNAKKLTAAEKKYAKLVAQLEKEKATMDRIRAEKDGQTKAEEEEG